MTELLYHPANEYQKEFNGKVEKSDVNKGFVVLDKTLFYKQGGGQPPDHGVLTWDGNESHVTDVRKDHGEVRHYLEGDIPDQGAEVHGKIDWERRYNLMKMHTAQHIISKVVLDEYGASTAGNQVHVGESRIDFEPADFDDSDLEDIESKTNEIINADLEVTKSEVPRQKLESETEEGRTNLDLIPDHIDPLRAVEISDIDICPCGGTHVDSTGEVGQLEITQKKTKGKDVERIRFTLN